MRIRFLPLLVLAVTLCFCLPAFAADTYSLKLGHTGAPNHHYQEICILFAKKVEEGTGGKVKIAIFPSDQLGRQAESVEGVMLGTHDMVLTSDVVLSNWVPDMGILNLPFIFSDAWAARAALDGPAGKKLAKKMEVEGAVVIGWWDQGMRHVTNSKKPITVPDDLKGLKIRMPEGEVFVETFKALGAGPTVISFGELYTALQLKTVDGQETSPAHIVSLKLHEVQKYVSRTGHIYTASPLIMNKKLLDGMPEEYRNVILQAGEECGPIHTKIIEEQEKGQWEEIAKSGMIINDVDKAPFREKVKPVIENFKKKLDASLIEEIMAAGEGKK